MKWWIIGAVLTLLGGVFITFSETLGMIVGIPGLIILACKLAWLIF